MIYISQNKKTFVKRENADEKFYLRMKNIHIHQKTPRRVLHTLKKYIPHIKNHIAYLKKRSTFVGKNIIDEKNNF